MKRITILLSFVFCVLALFAQTKIENNTPYNNYIANSAANFAEAEEEEQITDKTLASQTTVPLYQQTKEWEKYKKLNKTGWIMFGSGLGGVLVGSTIMLADVAGKRVVTGLGATIALAGTLSTLSSIPVLIIGAHYRNKAKHLNLGVSTISTPNTQMQFSYTPALSLSYSF